MPFVNPYNFVRKGTCRPTEAAPQHHDRFTGRQGTLTCVLKTLTPLFVPASQERANTQHNSLRFCVNAEGKAIIPGTSMKGCLRSLAEAISNSCSPFGGGSGHCRQVGSLCICCRMFGWLEGGERHRGHVAISDAVQTGGDPPREMMTIPELGTPKPSHRAFYPLRDGRKFYYHRVPPPVTFRAQRGPRNATIQPVDRGAGFEFTVTYENLSGPELGLLCYALEPGPRMYHKIGAAKPLGLGTCAIAVTHWRETHVTGDGPRYERYGDEELDGNVGAGATELDGRQACAPMMKAVKRAYVHDVFGTDTGDDLWRCPGPNEGDPLLPRDDNLADLEILLAQPMYRDPIHYPGYDWFRRNPGQALPSTQDVHNGSTLPD